MLFIIQRRLVHHMLAQGFSAQASPCVKRFASYVYGHTLLVNAHP